MRIAEVMCHSASLRLMELVAEVSHGTAFLWRHKVFSTVDSWQEKVVFSGRVWIDAMYFNDTDLLHDLGRKPRRGLSKDLICVVVAIDAFKNVLAVVSEHGKPSTGRVNAALETHIRPGSTIVHDRLPSSHLQQHTFYYTGLETPAFSQGNSVNDRSVPSARGALPPWRALSTRGVPPVRHRRFSLSQQTTTLCECFSA